MTLIGLLELVLVLVLVLLVLEIYVCHMLFGETIIFTGFIIRHLLLIIYNEKLIYELILLTVRLASKEYHDLLFVLNLSITLERRLRPQ